MRVRTLAKTDKRNKIDLGDDSKTKSENELNFSLQFAVTKGTA